MLYCVLHYNDKKTEYLQTSDINRSFVGNKIVDNFDVLDPFYVGNNVEPYNAMLYTAL